MAVSFRAYVFCCLVLLGTLGTQAVEGRQCKVRRKPYWYVLYIPTEECGPVSELEEHVGPTPIRVSSHRATPRTLNAMRQDSETAKKMMHLFPGLFLNETTAKELNTKLKKKQPSIPPVTPNVVFPSTIGPDLPGRKAPTTRKPEGRPSLGTPDGDLHCPTYRNLQKARAKLSNVQKERRDIVHFPQDGVYQYVHKGTCGRRGRRQRCGNGKCVQETSVVYLMVWTNEPETPTRFEAFEVDSYCSCRGVTF